MRKGTCSFRLSSRLFPAQEICGDDQLNNIFQRKNKTSCLIFFFTAAVNIDFCAVKAMPQLSEVGMVTVVDEVSSWSSAGGHKIGAWFASLGSKRGRRKAAAVAAANSTNNVHAVGNNYLTATRSFTLGKENKNILRVKR